MPEIFTHARAQEIIAEFFGDDEVGPVQAREHAEWKGQTLALFNKMLARPGGGIAFFQNEDLSSRDVGEWRMASFGHPDAQFETDDVPPIMPDTQTSINWRFTLKGTYKGDMVGDVVTQPDSGYTPCGCRDCMDVSISSDMKSPELCSACKEAECTVHNNLPGFMTGYGLGMECQRLDAYGCGDDVDE
jgi:hypothetical protein